MSARSIVPTLPRRIIFDDKCDRRFQSARTTLKVRRSRANSRHDSQESYPSAADFAQGKELGRRRAELAPPAGIEPAFHADWTPTLRRPLIVCAPIGHPPFGAPFPSLPIGHPPFCAPLFGHPPFLPSIKPLYPLLYWTPAFPSPRLGPRPSPFMGHHALWTPTFPFLIRLLPASDQFAT